MSTETAWQPEFNKQSPREGLQLVPSVVDGLGSDFAPGGAIADWSEPKQHSIPGVGLVSTSAVTLEDGSNFDFRKIVPEAQASGISADFMPPLGTAVGGFNTYVGHQLAKAGIHSRIVGTNRANGHTLRHDAQAALAILWEDDERTAHNQTCEPGKSISLGYSMGTLKALALIGLAPAMDRSVELALCLDPGPAKKIDYTPLEALKFAAWSAEQAAEIPKIFFESWQDTTLPRTLARTRHLVPTMSLHPKALWNTVDKLHTITRGEACSFPAAIPQDAAMIIHFFNSRASYNHPETYQALLKGHPNVRFVLEKGAHLAGARMSAVRALVAKTAHGLQLIEQGTSRADLSEALSYPILRPRS